MIQTALIMKSLKLQEKKLRLKNSNFTLSNEFNNSIQIFEIKKNDTLLDLLSAVRLQR